MNSRTLAWSHFISTTSCERNCVLFCSSVGAIAVPIKHSFFFNLTMSQKHTEWAILIVFCIITSYYNVDCYRILGVSPSTMRSHYIFFEALMKGLAEDGNNVTFISPFQSSETANFEEIQIDLPIKIDQLLGEPNCKIIETEQKRLIVPFSRANAF